MLRGMPSLKWIVAEGRPRTFPIYKKITTIGRGKANDVVVEDGSLETNHAQIVFDGRDFHLYADPGAVLTVFIR